MMSSRVASAGTPSWMAPEQFVGEWRDFGPWTDLYALGAVGWALVSGGPPFPGSDWMELMDAHMRRKPHRLGDQGELPDGVEDWLRWLLEKDPAWRPQSAAEAARELTGLVGGSGLPVFTKPSTESSPTSPWKRKETPTGSRNRATSKSVAPGGAAKGLKIPSLGSSSDAP